MSTRLVHLGGLGQVLHHEARGPAHAARLAGRRAGRRSVGRVVGLGLKDGTSSRVEEPMSVEESTWTPLAHLGAAADADLPLGARLLEPLLRRLRQPQP